MGTVLSSTQLGHVGKQQLPSNKSKLQISNKHIDHKAGDLTHDKLGITLKSSSFIKNNNNKKMPLLI